MSNRGSTTEQLHRVAVPSEHGGWSLTLEPVLLGLLVAPSLAGTALGVAALLAFLARTPLKMATIDRRRDRRLARTALAERVATVEIAVLVTLLVVAWAVAGHPFWVPLALAAPLVAVAFSYDVRSRSRRLLPELAGTIGIASVAAAIALAGGGAPSIAYGLWVVAASRAVATIPFVRAQLARAKRRATPLGWVVGTQVVAVLAVGAGLALGSVSVWGVVAIAALAVAQLVLVRLPVPRVAVIGAQQVVLGLTVVLVTGLGVLAP